MINEFYLRGCLAVVRAARARSGVSMGCVRLFGRRFVESMEPPVRTRIKARRVAEPAPTMPREQLVPLFKASHDGYRQLVTAGAATDVNRVIMPNLLSHDSDAHVDNPADHSGARPAPPVAGGECQTGADGIVAQERRRIPAFGQTAARRSAEALKRPLRIASTADSQPSRA